LARGLRTQETAEDLERDHGEYQDNDEENDRAVLERVAARGMQSPFDMTQLFKPSRFEDPSLSDEEAIGGLKSAINRMCMQFEQHIG
jgi:hypothetical protein